MVEKRKLSPAPDGKGKYILRDRYARSKLENDLRWKWIGSEVTHFDDITLALCLRAAGLELQDGRGPCRNRFAGDVNLDSSADDKELDFFCTKRRCKDSPFCLNFLGQEQWENEGASPVYCYDTHGLIVH